MDVLPIYQGIRTHAFYFNPNPEFSVSHPSYRFTA